MVSPATPTSEQGTADGPSRAEPDSPSRAELGARLRLAREAAGLTLRDVARSLQTSTGTWSAVENGRTGLSDQRLAAAARLLGAQEDALLAPLEPGPPVPLGWRDFPPLRLPPPLSGALAAFVDVGYHGATVRDIAQRAGLSVPGVYHHWPSKQHLLVALLDLTMDDLQRRSGAALAEGEGPAERLSGLVECLALFHTHRRDLGLIGASEMRSLEEPSRSRIAGLRTRQQRRVDAEVLEGCRQGLFRTPLPHEAARAVVTMCTALPTWWSAAGPETPEAVASQYVTFALDLVRVAR